MGVIDDLFPGFAAKRSEMRLKKARTDIALKMIEPGLKAPPVVAAMMGGVRRVLMPTLRTLRPWPSFATGPEINAVTIRSASAGLRGSLTTQSVPVLFRCLWRSATVMACG